MNRTTAPASPPPLPTVERTDLTFLQREKVLRVLGVARVAEAVRKVYGRHLPSLVEAVQGGKWPAVCAELKTDLGFLNTPKNK